MNAGELEAMIREAFNGVRLDGGTSLLQAEVMDNYGEGVTDKEFAALPLQEITDNWAALSPETLAKYSYLPHMDAKGFRYYIPAFMINSLRGYDSLDTLTEAISALYPSLDKDSWDYAMMHYSQLDNDQLRAVAKFLKWLPEIIELGWEDQTRAERAIRNFWHQYL